MCWPHDENVILLHLASFVSKRQIIWWQILKCQKGRSMWGGGKYLCSFFSVFLQSASKIRSMKAGGYTKINKFRTIKFRTEIFRTVSFRTIPFACWTNSKYKTSQKNFGQFNLGHISLSEIKCVRNLLISPSIPLYFVADIWLPEDLQDPVRD